MLTLFTLYILTTLTPIPGQVMPVNESVYYGLSESDCSKKLAEKVSAIRAEGKYVLVKAECVRSE